MKSLLCELDNSYKHSIKEMGYGDKISFDPTIFCWLGKNDVNDNATNRTKMKIKLFYIFIWFCFF